LGTSGFPIQKRDIFYKIKEINGLRGDVLQYAAQVIPQIDDEIVKNSHLWMEISLAIQIPPVNKKPAAGPLPKMLFSPKTMW
jgi:hypothetical protein